MAKTPPPSDDNDAPALPGKGKATPTRAEQEAARKRPLVPDTKEAKARARAELNNERARARAGMAAGEEKYLPPRDKGPQRSFVRDFVDSRWRFSEFLMPAMVVVILVSMMGTLEIQNIAFIALWGFVALAVIEMTIVATMVKRALRRKFGANRLERGTGWYAAMRTMQMRFMRMPKAKVRRGEKIA